MEIDSNEWAGSHFDRCRRENVQFISGKPISILISGFSTQCLGDWAYFVAMIDLPKYMNDVIHMDAQSNGIYSSLPYIAYVALSLYASFLSDQLIASGRISITNARKLFVILCEPGDYSAICEISQFKASIFYFVIISVHD